MAALATPQMAALILTSSDSALLFPRNNAALLSALAASLDTFCCPAPASSTMVTISQKLVSPNSNSRPCLETWR